MDKGEGRGSKRDMVMQPRILSKAPSRQYRGVGDENFWNNCTGISGRWIQTQDIPKDSKVN